MILFLCVRTGPQTLYHSIFKSNVFVCFPIEPVPPAVLLLAGKMTSMNRRETLGGLKVGLPTEYNYCKRKTAKNNILRYYQHSKLEATLY